MYQTKGNAILIVLIGVVIIASLYFYQTKKPQEIFPTKLVPTTTTSISTPTIISVTPTTTPAPIVDKHDVPFSAQAPFGDWADPRQQDGCEEMASIIAVKWARGESLTKDEALSTLLDISKFEEEKYGSSRDTSATDTNERIIKDYFHFDGSKTYQDITLTQIKEELAKGNLVIVPTDGQLLGNPHYTPPGPERHMVVIIGYDAEKNEFITNDPGTKFGKNYRYNAKVLFNAIRDYPTGDHVPITEISRSMIVIPNL